MNNPNLLVARVLEVKYYSTSSFMEVGLGNQPSLVWHSIWAIKGLLQMRSGWQVGNGRLVSIWDDTWLFSNKPCKIQSNRISGIEKVADLIDVNQRDWKVELVRTSFLTRMCAKY